jgi:DNA polymerase-3 subunit epsilon
MSILSDPRLVVLDVETTGTDVATDRIVQFCFWRVADDRQPYVRLVNPGRPIPPEATAVHGITDEMVANEPKFWQYASGIQAGLRIFAEARSPNPRPEISDTILLTYNGSRFDLPLLDAELRRCVYGDRRLPGLGDATGRITIPEIDLYVLWRWGAEQVRQAAFAAAEDARGVDEPFVRLTAMEVLILTSPRTFSDAVRIFAGREHEGAHSAEADALALPAVLEGMVSAFDLEDRTVDDLCALCVPPEMVDRAGKFRRDEDGTVRFAFGGHRGEPVADHPGFLEWMLDPRRDFAPDTLSYAREFLQTAYAGAGA